MKRKSEDPQDTAAAPALNYGSVHRVFTETLDEHCIKACALLSQDDGHLKIIYYADLDPTMAAVCVKLWALTACALNEGLLHSWSTYNLFNRHEERGPEPCTRSD